MFIQKHLTALSKTQKGKFASLICCLGSSEKQSGSDIDYFSATNEAQLGHGGKWHYEKCCKEMLFVLHVIAGVFNVIAAIYFQVAEHQGSSVCP